MSKIINVLNGSSSPRKEMHASVKEEIAKTYFKGSETKTRKERVKSKTPWVVAAIALIITAAVLATRSSIDIKIMIRPEMPVVREQPADGQARYIKEEKKGNTFFVKDAEINIDLVKKAHFMGDAQPASKMEDGQVILKNSKGHGWANYTMELKNPIDLSGLDIEYIAKGELGNERLIMAMVDLDNRSYRAGGDAAAKLAADWQTYRMDLTSVKNVIDLRNVSVIRFEFGTLTAGNSHAATIFLKDIYLSKAKDTR